MNLANMTDYHHFPIYSVMVLFLGAFIIASTGSKPSKDPKNPAGFRAWIALCATALSLFFLGSLVKPVMLEGEYPGPRRGAQYLDATLYTLDFLFKTPPARVYTFGVKPEVLQELESYSKWLCGRAWDHKFRSLQILEVLQ